MQDRFFLCGTSALKVHRNVIRLLSANYKGENLLDARATDRCKRNALHLLCQFANHSKLKLDLIKALIDRNKTIKDSIKAVDANGNIALYHLCGRELTAEDNVSTDDADDELQTDGLGRNALDLLCEYYNGPESSENRSIIIAANH